MSTDIDVTEAALLSTMLSSDNVPDENQAGQCFACDAQLQGLFCSECGQKNDNYRRSIFALIADLFVSVFSLESRIWKTWATMIFRPGKVPREFSDGKRSQWSSPIRVYLAMSIILFGFMGVTNTHLISVDVDPKIKEGVEKPYEELEKGDIQTKWQVHFFETQKSIDSRNATRDLHLLEIWLSERSVKMTPEQRENLNAEIEKSLGEINKAVSEFKTSPAGPILETIQDEIANAEPEVDDVDQIIPDSVNNSISVDEDGGLNLTLGGRRLTNADSTALMLNFIKNPSVVTRSFNTWLPRLMFIMMPFTMLLGAFFIRDKKKALLFDHLVHATYIHAFAFFLLFAGILASKVTTGAPIFQVIFIAFLIYLPLSLKGMFGRGWFKTFITSYGVGFMYLVIIMLALIGVISVDVAQNLDLSRGTGA